MALSPPYTGGGVCGEWHWGCAHMGPAMELKCPRAEQDLDSVFDCQPCMGATRQPGDVWVTVWLLCTLVPLPSLGKSVLQGDRDEDPPRLSATFGLVVGGRELSDSHSPPRIPFQGC